MTERQYLLMRCLRLEQKILALRRKLAETRPNRRYVTDADRAYMCELRRRGASVRTIARTTGWSEGTVYNVVHAPTLVERAVGE